MGRIDINDLIVENGGDPKKIKESQRRRFVQDGDAGIDETIVLFAEHKKEKYNATQVKASINKMQKDSIGKIMKDTGKATKDLAAAKKAGGDTAALEATLESLKTQKEEVMAQKAALEKQYKELEESAAEKYKVLDKKGKAIGNYVHDSVPVSDTEDDNVTVRTWAPEGVTVEKKEGWHLSHHDVLSRLDGWESDMAVGIAGHRSYFLKGTGCRLNEAIKQYAMRFLDEKDYEPLQTPYFMNQSAMAKTAQLDQFDEELYKVDDGGEPKYLIATSEQPISAMYQNSWLTDKDLPKKFAGLSTCFRKEAGKHGKDAWGLFRTHQFDKVEQFLITEPEKSWDAFENMIANSEEFYKSLGIPYQVVAIVSGALNDAAAKKYDLEGWFPFQGEYKELVSCSNCTDYQSRDLEVRYGQKLQTDTRKNYVHMLNCTLSATGRTLCAILENFQTEEGLVVPEPLRRYIRGEPEFMPYTKALDKNSTSAKMQNLNLKAE